MKGTGALDFRNPLLVSRLGIEALVRYLGLVGMTYYLQQYDRGSGDYTEDRKQLFHDATHEELMKELELVRERRESDLDG